MTQITLTHALVRAIRSLNDDGVPMDIRELLLHGDDKQSVKSGALVRACLAFQEPKAQRR